MKGLSIEVYEDATRIARELTSHIHPAFLTVGYLNRMRELEAQGWHFLQNEQTGFVKLESPNRDVFRIEPHDGGMTISREGR